METVLLDSLHRFYTISIFTYSETKIVLGYFQVSYFLALPLPCIWDI